MEFFRYRTTSLFRSLLIYLCGGIFLFVFPLQQLFAEERGNSSIKLANYYLRAGTDITHKDFARLASYDLLILPMEAAVYNRDFFEYARRLNPDIILLAYIPARSINIRDIDDGAKIRKRLKSGIKDEWYLRNSAGNIVPAWRDTIPLNLTTEWNSYLPKFVKDVVLKEGIWNGVLYDEIDTRFSLFNNGDLDLNRDGVTDMADAIDSTWSAGVVSLLKRSRELFGINTVIMINGSSHPPYQPFIQGRIFERFPTPWEGNGRWSDSMKPYLSLPSAVMSPPLFIINRTTENTGKKNDYRNMRYGLTSALLGDGYYSFDFGDKDHGQLWWYDEYSIPLGKSLSEPKRADHFIQTPDSSEGVWRREFQNGVVFVNATDHAETIEFSENFEKIHGVQDSTTNDGGVISSLSLKPKDGIILLRPIERLSGAFFKNGSFVRIFDKNGNVKRTGFFAYDSSARGSAFLAFADLDRDGKEERIIADNTSITIFWPQSGVTIFSTPFGKKWNGELNCALSDINKDGVSDLIIAPEARKEKQKKASSILIIDTRNGKIISSFQPFGNGYRGSVRVAAGDLDNDGTLEIIAAKGSGEMPQVVIFTAKGKEIAKFLAYDPRFRGGVAISVGDSNGDGEKEIFTAPGRNGSPHIRIFNKGGKPLTPGFLAFNTSQRNGIGITSADLDGDGIFEIIPMTTNVFTTSILKK